MSLSWFEEDEDLATRSWLAKWGGRRLRAPTTRRQVPSVARWLAEKQAPQSFREPVVHLLGAKTGRRPRKCRLHRVLAETAEDLDELEDYLDGFTTPEVAKEAGKSLEQFALGARIGYGSVFCTAPERPPGLHPRSGSRSLAIEDGARRDSISLPSQTDYELAATPDDFMDTFQDTERLLPWEPARHFLKPGSIATVHSSRARTARALAQSEQGQTWAGPWSQRLLDRKWYLRQASCSATNARAQGSPRLKLAEMAALEGSQSSAEYMHFQGWSLDDDYACTLFRQIRLQELLAINLSENRLTETFVNFLLEVSDGPLPLQSLHLAKNHLGHLGGQAVAKFLGLVKCPLRHFDISENALGDVAAAQICDSLRQVCRGSLQGLRMAKNLAGGAFGPSMQALLSQAVHLQSLDLHWNKIDGSNAAAIFQGLKTNYRRKGRLWNVNLAWNCIGLRCQRENCTCELCENCTRAVKSLATIFLECDSLYHLDLSYNSLSASDCEVFGEALKSNRSLFGLHLAGNGAYLDDIGMVRCQLAHGAPREVEELLQRERVRRELDTWVRNMPQQLRPERMGRYNEDVKLANEPFSPSLRRVEKSDAFSEEDIGFEKAWLGVQSKVQPAFRRPLEEVTATESCCWICENWVEQEVHYIPGWSGPLEEVTKVFAYFSIDGFTRPNLLSRTLERYWKRDFPERSLLLEEGRVVCFRGARMLPPSHQRIQVIFQVNDTLRCAEDLPSVRIFTETFIRLHSDGRQRPEDAPPPLLVPLDQEPIRISEANEIDVRLRANAIFEEGSEALFRLEHSRSRVVPRSLTELRSEPAWSFESSIFKDYQRDAIDIASECFHHDYKLTRLHRLWRKLQKDRYCDVAAVMQLLESSYEAFLAAYAFESILDSNKSIGLSMASFSRVLLGSQGAFESTRLFGRPSAEEMKELFSSRASLLRELPETHPLKEGFSFGRADAIYTASLTESDQTLKGLPLEGLARFQFLEVFVTCASLETFSPLRSLRRWMKATGLGHQMGHRRALHAAVFTEDCCQCLRRHKKMLQEVYDIYQKRFRMANEPSMLSFASFLQYLDDSRIGLDPLDQRLAFAAGKELCVEQHRSLRHVVLSFSEFLVCTAAAVYLSGDFVAEELPDRLLDFLLDSLPLALSAGRAFEMEEAGCLASQDPQTLQLVTLLSRIFSDADEDGSGWLTVQEFYEACQQPRVVSSLEELGVVIGDVKLLFLRMDVDDSGEISLREFVEGFLKLRNEMLSLQRGIRALRKLFFKLETKYGTGRVTKEQFVDFARASVEALEHAGLRESDVSDLWAAAQQGTTVTSETLVAGYMDLQLEKGRAIRGMNFLNSIFRVADLDGSGALSKAEVAKCFCRQEVTEKLVSLQLSVPDWLEMFDAMDINGDGDLTWTELSNAMKHFWAQGTSPVEVADSGVRPSRA